MPGNEILLHRMPKTKNYLGTERKDSISTTLRNNAFECFYALEDILEYLDTKKLSDNEDNNKDEKNKKKEIKTKSKLFYLLGNVAFDANKKSIQYNRKYIIVGAIFGNSGLITNIKNTLNFLSQCQKLSHQKIKNKNKNNEYFDNTFFKENINTRNKNSRIKSYNK